MVGRRLTKGIQKIAALLIAWMMVITGVGMIPVQAEAAGKQVVKKLTVAKSSLSLEEGESESIRYQVTAAKKTSKKIVLKVSNKKVISAKVSKGKIVVRAKKEGSSTITVTTKARNGKGKKIKKKIKVVVKKENEDTKSTEVSAVAEEETEEETEEAGGQAAATETTASVEEISTEKVTEKTVTTKVPAATAKTTAAKQEETLPSISYQAYVQDIGWMSAVKAGATAGTTGKAKYLEALKINLKDKKGNSMIKYRAHVQNVGWQGWMTSGQTAGTEKQSERMEGIQIQLTGNYAEQYDIYYCVHVANFGWLGWAKNGEVAGSQGLSLQMEAIQIRLVRKNTAFAVGDRHVIVAPKLTYQAHCEKYGWQNAVSVGNIAGTVGEGRQLEGIKINLLDTDGKSGVEYRAHVSNVGWQDWKNSGALAGTTGEARRMEAVEIRLKGNIANEFDIYYRMHVSKIGWMGWAKNGETAGTTGGSRQAEAIQIKIVAKGAPVEREGVAYQKLTAQSKVGYNADAALKYASEHWNDGQGLCAEFVSKCVQAGGISIKTEYITTNCYNAVSNATGVQGQVLKLNAAGYATKSLDGDILSAGDVVIQWCNTHTYRPHILICGGYDSAGYATFYAHNSAKNNQRFRFNVTYSSQAPCNHNCDIGARVLHISN